MLMAQILIIKYLKRLGSYDSLSLVNLKQLRQSIYEIVAEFNLDEQDPEIGFNNFHNLVKNLLDTELNKKSKYHKKISNNHKLVDLIFSSFAKKLRIC